jgi:hypothetical protein
LDRHNENVLRDELEAHLRGFSTAPFLLVGSGMSMRYLGAENWEDLLRVFAAKTSLPFERYRSEASSRYPQIATAIATEFADVWWDDDAYKASRTEYADETTSFDSPLKIEVCAHMMEALNRLDEDGPYAAELAALRRAEVDGIITTNYDQLMEMLFPDFVPFVGQSQVLFSATQGVAEIYKIHGSVEEPNSLVLTYEDYENFTERNAYLAARLLTIFVDHPVVFLGYSMSDDNIRDILGSIALGLTSDHLDKLRNPLIFIEYDRAATDPMLERSTFSIGATSIPVMRAGVSDYEPVYVALASLERHIPVRWLRQMKERVYELVRTTDPVGAIRVVGIEDDKHIDELEVAIGFGIVSHLGIRGIDRGDLLDDVLLDTGKWDPRPVVDEALPGILRRAQIAPVYRYLRGADLLTPDGQLTPDAGVGSEIAHRVANHAAVISPSPDSYKQRGDALAAEGTLFADLVDEEDAWHALMYATCLPPEAVPVDELRDFLLDHRTVLYETHRISWKYAWMKGVCLYDRLAYGTVKRPAKAKTKAKASTPQTPPAGGLSTRRSLLGRSRDRPPKGRHGVPIAGVALAVTAATGATTARHGRYSVAKRQRSGALARQ